MTIYDWVWVVGIAWLVVRFGFIEYCEQPKKDRTFWPRFTVRGKK